VAFETLDDMIRSDARRHDPHKARRELHQGAQQGHPQGHGQDGDLDAPELLRRADLRGVGLEPRVVDRYFPARPRASAASAST
jgi:hypothetical protein